MAEAMHNIEAQSEVAPECMENNVLHFQVIQEVLVQLGNCEPLLLALPCHFLNDESMLRCTFDNKARLLTAASSVGHTRYAHLSVAPEV